MRTQALLHVTLPVSSLDRLAAFYAEALGFLVGEAAADSGTASLLGAQAIRTRRMRRGAQVLELAEHDPPGAPYPVDRAANDLIFQHLALTVGDMREAYARLCRTPHEAISRGGPVTLPGGIVAYKFRDPDGHPLELIELPDGDSATREGIDHSAIAVSDAERSIAFYRDVLGFGVAARQVNAGPAQDALDGLSGVRVDVVGLSPAVAAPHLELLGYRAPHGRARGVGSPVDIAASRLVLEVDGVDGAMAMADPDGHGIVLLPVKCSDDPADASGPVFRGFDVPFLPAPDRPG